MDMTTIAVASFCAIFIMQAIILVFAVRINRAVSKNNVQKPAEQTQHFPRERDNRFRSRRDERPDRRPETRPQPQTPQPQQVTPASPSDKSLRDINLKLRNAERDQERARRTIDPPKPQAAPVLGQPAASQTRNEPRRDPRDRNFDRNRRDGNRSGNRDQRDSRGNWQRGGNRDWQENRNSRPQTEPPVAPLSINISAPAQPVMPAQPVISPADISPVSTINDTQRIEPVIAPVTATVAQVSEAPSPAESFEHGRKISVKRRVLPNETGAEGSDSQPGETASAAQEPAREQPSSQNAAPSAPAADVQPIQFGRR